MPSKKVPRLKPKKVKGRIKVLKAILYKKSMVYIRQIDEEIFEYLVVFKNQIYSSYLIIKPKKGMKKLTKNEVNQSAALIFTGAIATIDTLLGKKLDKNVEKNVKLFESGRKQLEAKPN